MREHVLDQIALYLDDELQGEERRALEVHVAACAPCRARLEDERDLIAVMRQARPLYLPPDDLRSRIALSLAQSSAPSRPLASIPWWARAGARVWIAVAAILLLAFSAPLLWHLARRSGSPQAGPSELALVAVETHQRYVRGQLPLEIQSHSPEVVSGWFADKVPFNLKLPNYPEWPDQPKPYELEGARLIGFKQDYAAYVSYQMRQRPISLLVTSETAAQPSGGEVIAWQGLQFHFDAINGWKVLTWSDQGLTYALVSDFEERGQASCIVCHPGPQDQRMFEGLKPK
jgi:anti-sigma factor RsiW